MCGGLKSAWNRVAQTQDILEGEAGNCKGIIKLTYSPLILSCVLILEFLINFWLD